MQVPAGMRWAARCGLLRTLLHSFGRMVQLGVAGDSSHGRHLTVASGVLSECLVACACTGSGTVRVPCSSE